MQRPEKPCLEKKEGITGKPRTEQVKENFVGNEGFESGVWGGCVFVCPATK